jgi:hypothetical protein
MEGNPREVDPVRVSLHQDWEMQWKVTDLVMLDRSWPGEIQTSKPIDHDAPGLHPKKGIGITDPATDLTPMRSVTASDAVVADASTDRRRWAGFAFEAAGRGHGDSPSKTPNA